MSIWIIYGLVIVFLLAFPLLVLALVQSPGASVQTQQSGIGTGSHVDRITYGALAALLVIFVVIAFVAQKDKGAQN